MTGKAHCMIVALGASAGGLEAYQHFFDAMPDDSGMAFVLIQHLSPSHQSSLTTLLSKHTKMPVVEVEEKMRIEPNHVHIIPPNRYLTLAGGVFHLQEPPDDLRVYLPIDLFFRSLAEDCEERAVAVVLSGTGSDGTNGVREIKARGGLTFAQRPETAGYDGMPASAIDSGFIDQVLTLEEMADALATRAQHPRLLGDNSASTLEGSVSENLQPILSLLRVRARQDFRAYKPGMLIRRIGRRMNLHGITDVAQYVKLLRDNPDELQQLGQDLLIGVTSFFREPDSFHALDQQVISKLVERKAPDEELKIWVPGCATGEEAYSIAILVAEAMRAQNKAINVRIFATDVDQPALEIAREGVYPTNVAADVSDERLSRYFIKSKNHYRVHKFIRETITFAVQNLITDPPFSKLDLLSCRNLLIYLEPSTQKKLISMFHFALNAGGYLFLGRSETLGELSKLFEPVSEKCRLFRQKPGALRVHPALPIPADEARSDTLSMLRTKADARAHPDVGDIARERLLESYAPASILIDRRYKVLYFHGDTSPYLKLPPGEPSYDLMSLAQRELASSIRAAVRQALSNDKPVAISGVQLHRQDTAQSVTVTAMTVQHARLDEKLVLVSFESTDSAPAQNPIVQAADMDDSVAARLELELQATKEDLQGSIEELETSNEEVMSMNEELQATNEELETSKEEMQALNEELTTVNSELQQKVEELQASSDEMQDLLFNTHIATLFLDTGLHIKRFTPDVKKLFNLIDTDVDRPIMDIAGRFTGGSTLIEDARTVLQNLTSTQTEVRSEEGRWYLRRVLPYRTHDDQIRGVVITFVDVSELLQAQMQEREARARAENIVAVAHEGLVVLDSDHRVVAANPAFYETFQVDPEDTENRSLFELGNGQWDIPQLHELLEEVLPENTAFQDYEVEHDFPAIGRKTMLLNARHLQDKDGSRDQHIVLAITDITERKQAYTSALVASEHRFRALYDDNPTMYFTVDKEGEVLSVNRFGAGKLGYEVDELIGESFFKLHREDVNQARTRVAECFEKPGEVYEWDTRIECKNATLMWVRENARAVQQNDAEPTVLVVCEDITETRKLMRQVTYHATHDSLTSLENRREFELRLARVLETVLEEKTDNVLCYMDLDRFKAINDTCGHLAGDELLRQIGEVLRSNVRTRDTVARLGGDEFGVLMEHCNLVQGERVARDCRRAVENFRFRWEDKTFAIGVSVGVLAITPQFRYVADVLEAADSACYAAKLHGRNHVSVYNDGDAEMARRHSDMEWLTQISDALKRGGLQLSYQPIVSLTDASGGAVHYELLVRFQDDQGEETSAAQFLPTAERYDLAVKLDRWVTETALDWLEAHPAQLKSLSWCSINLSGQTLGDEDYLEFVKEKLSEGPVPPAKLCFEITETAAISNIASAIEFMRALKALGCLFALDDFGSGFSSFGYLKTLPVDFLKIDGSFVKDMDKEPVDYAMVKSLNEIGHVMGKKTIAEYVERESVLEKLREIGIDYAQGNAFGAPQPLDAML